MNKITLALFSMLLMNIYILSTHTSDTKEITVCHTPATEEFAAFASIKAFRDEHKDPIPFTYTSEAGESISFDTPDGQKANALFFKSENKSDKYLFVIHEWYGLNDYIKQTAEKLFNDLDNVNVVALDMYDGKVADNAKDAGQYMQAMKTERGEAIIKGAMNMAGKDARIYTIGWCFGGGWSLQASLLAGDQASGCIIYYGMPEKDVEKLKSLNTDVLGIWGDSDGWINPQVVQEFEANMKKAGKNLNSNSYKAGHGFSNPSNPVYDPTSSANAYAKTLLFLNERMK